MKFHAWTLLIFLALLGFEAEAQAFPRARDGHPDFSGAWTSSFITPLERMPGATGLRVSEAEAKALGQKMFDAYVARENGLDPDVLAADTRNLLRIGNEYRTSLVVEPADGKVPLTAEGLKLIAKARQEMPNLPDDPEARPEWDRCITGAGRAPLALTPTINARQIVQTHDSLALYTEDGPDLRIISIGGQHRPAAVAMWGGDSTATWEGDTLVIETVNQRGMLRVGVTYGFIVRPEAKVIERLKFLSPDEILYSYTVLDPKFYSAPWRVEFTFTRSKVAATEYGCHEGNYALVNMLHSARFEQRRAEAVSGR